ncbi:MAG: hypothetical protein AB1330_00975 [Bacillota bacterium]
MHLKGRPIGLKAFMSKEQMKKHLIKVREEWLAEGFSEAEVTNAVLSKCHPLLVGYYWARFPESSERLAEALRELGYSASKRPQRVATSKLPKTRPGKKALNGSLAMQFKEVMG